MNFEELEEFISSKMRVKKGHNYQPVMIKTLLQNDGKASKDEIRSELQKENPHHEKKHFDNSLVFKLLTENHPVAIFDKTAQKYVLLDYGSLSVAEWNKLVFLCEQKIHNTSNTSQEAVKQSPQKRVQGTPTSTQKRICNGTCKKFRVFKSHGKGRYSSGQGHCQVCDVWIDHNGCHMKDGSPAKKNSLGWFCNCCSYRVRQKPRNKKYKEKFHSTTAQNNAVQDSYDNNSHDSTTTNDIHISKGQASILKILSRFMPRLGKRGRFADVVGSMPDYLRRTIQDNWDLDEFGRLATDYEHPNKISMIVLFEHLKEELGTVPTKVQFMMKTSVEEDLITKEFKSWEHFLELLRYDPWYREDSKASIQSRKTASLEPKRGYDKSTAENEYFYMPGSTEKIATKVNALRKQMRADYRLRDSQDSSADYSYEEMLSLLERYLMLLPASKYSSIDDFV